MTTTPTRAWLRSSGDVQSTVFKIGAAALLLALNTSCVVALNNGLGLTPPLGYNAYDHIGCCANETTMMRQGQALINTGLTKLGYTYVNMDCGWIGGRHANGTLYESKAKFPHGIRALANWMHDRGLKLGVYSDRGTHDFSGSGLGMKGHEKQDADWMASVGVDYLKVDDMSGEPHTEEGAYADYATIRDALNATGRPIFFSTCGHSGASVGHPNTYHWAGERCNELANACRIAADVRYWGSGTFGTNKAVNAMAFFNGTYSRGGSWPDPDLLFGSGPVGPSGLNRICKGSGNLEYCTGSFCDPIESHSKTQFGLWAIMGAPLLLSFDLELLLVNKTMLSLYANPEIISISQDSDKMGVGTSGGRRVSGGDFLEEEMEDLTSGCDARNFPNKLTGVEVEGLSCQNATSPEECTAKCCKDPKCTTWQWNANYSEFSRVTNCTSVRGGVYGACWIGEGTSVKPNGMWSGGSRSAPTPPSNDGEVNIWARNLYNGDVAMIFINNGDTPQAIFCDEFCVRAAGLHINRRYEMRDIFARESLEPLFINRNGFKTAVVPPDAGSVLLRLSLSK